LKAALRIEPDLIGTAHRTATVTVLDQITFYGTFGLLGFAPLAFGAVQPWSIFVVESAAAALFVMWLIAQVKSGELRISESPLFAPMAVFGGLIVVQILAGRTAYRYQAIHQGMLYCAYGLLCFLVMQCLRKTSQVNWLALAASAYGFGLAVFASATPSRRPLTNTSVRCGPRPLKSAVASPPAVVSALVRPLKSANELTKFCGNRLITSLMSLRPEIWMSFSVTT